MIDYFWVRDIYIYRSGSVAKNAYNDYEKSWTNPVLVSHVLGWIGPETSPQESNQDQEKVKGILLASFPVGTDIKYDDIITVDGPLGGGTKYLVNGNPAVGYTPRGQHHIEAYVEAVNG